MGRTLRIAICNERFLTRFGVDRFLVKFAEHLAQLGHDITFFCLRAEEDQLRTIADKIEILDGPTQENLLSFDVMVAAGLASRIRTGFDICLIGGWPFFQTAASMAGSKVQSVFIDAGGVPQDGFIEPGLSIQREVRRLREACLPFIDLVMPISFFIEETQTLPDRGSRQGVHLVHLGADHMTGADSAGVSEGEAALLRTLLDRRDGGTHIIVALGRMEQLGYKNSLALFDVLGVLVDAGFDVSLVILVGSETFHVPEHLSDYVITVPTISDAALQKIMVIAEVGLSPSLWEGFNFPVAEMQAAGSVALAFNIGAHAEIIADPAFLCETTGEMAAKAAGVIGGTFPGNEGAMQRLLAYRERFPWRRTLEQWTSLTIGASSGEQQTHDARVIIVDVSNSARDPANSGVIRVTRRLSAELVKQPDLTVLFAKWDAGGGRYVWLCDPDFSYLASNGGPNDRIGKLQQSLSSGRSIIEVVRALAPTGNPEPILFCPEVVLDGTAEHRVRWAHENGCTSAFIFHDMLPVFAANYVSQDVAVAFPAYLAAIGQAKAIFPNSVFSKNEYERWIGESGRPMPAERDAVWLPAQFGDAPRIRVRSDLYYDPVELLCVSTIEPRKNHATLIEAFQILLQRSNLPLRLNLVGNSYAGEHGLSDWIHTICRANPQIVWHGIVEDQRLEQLYARALFTIYPSLAEGFGMPIMESIWLGCPCICHAEGVMAELAAGGGCMTVDMTSAESLAIVMAKLLTDHDLYSQLSSEAASRDLRGWGVYGRSIADRLYRLDAE